MFDRFKKLFGKAQENPTVAQVSAGAQDALNTVKDAANTVVDQAKDLKEQVMADGKVTMDDFGAVKDAATNLAGSVQQSFPGAVDEAKELLAKGQDLANNVQTAVADIKKDGIGVDDIAKVQQYGSQIATDAKDLVVDAVTKDTPTPPSTTA